MASSASPNSMDPGQGAGRDNPLPGLGLFDAIAALDARFRALDTRLPDEAPPVEEWAGVLFRVRDQRILAPMEQIVEVLEPSAEITAIPGTRPWVLGVVNNRGTLLPIFDLASLVHGGIPVRRDGDRILAVRQGELPCGLVVSEAIGIRHFAAAARLTETPPGLGVLRPFATAAYPLDGQPVAVLALDRLLADPLLNAALQV